MKDEEISNAQGHATSSNVTEGRHYLGSCMGFYSTRKGAMVRESAQGSFMDSST